MSHIHYDTIAPRFLKFRSHYRVYFIFFWVTLLMLSSYWFFQMSMDDWQLSWMENAWEISLTFLYILTYGSFYFLWLRPRLQRSVQVHASHIAIHNNKAVENVIFEDVESVSVVCWSLFFLKMKNGHKHYFNSSLERSDYVWEGLFRARPDLMTPDEYESFRLKLIQFDHHQKRKEWFFRHKLVDVFYWVVLPAMFLATAYMVQSRDVEIYQQGLYFFRLFMYSLLALLTTAFTFSLGLKKMVFDRKIKSSLEDDSDAKMRDLEFEGVILQRSKVFQVMTVCLVLGLVIRTNINLYSVTKIKEDIAAFSLKKGRTVVVDNRYNCVSCRYQVQDGDYVVFSRGFIGQVLAKEGDMVGEVSHDKVGRSIASENVQVVPPRHIALRASNGKDIVFVKIHDLIGKIQK